MSITTPAEDTASIAAGRTGKTGAQKAHDTSVTLGSLHGVDDPNAFARLLQEWKHAATDRNRLPRYR